MIECGIAHEVMFSFRFVSFRCSQQSLLVCWQFMFQVFHACRRCVLLISFLRHRESACFALAVCFRGRFELHWVAWTSSCYRGRGQCGPFVVHSVAARIFGCGSFLSFYIFASL